MFSKTKTKRKSQMPSAINLSNIQPSIHVMHVQRDTTLQDAPGHNTHCE